MKKQLDTSGSVLQRIIQAHALVLCVCNCGRPLYLASNVALEGARILI
jgi:hypothetical protein